MEQRSRRRVTPHLHLHTAQHSCNASFHRGQSSTEACCSKPGQPRHLTQLPPLNICPALQRPSQAHNNENKTGPSRKAQKNLPEIVDEFRRRRADGDVSERRFSLLLPRNQERLSFLTSKPLPPIRGSQRENVTSSSTVSTTGSGQCRKRKRREAPPSVSGHTERRSMEGLGEKNEATTEKA